MEMNLVLVELLVVTSKVATIDWQSEHLLKERCREAHVDQARVQQRRIPEALGEYLASKLEPL